MRTTATLSVLGSIVLASIAFALVPFISPVSASSDGVPASQRVATTTEVGPQQTKTLFAAGTPCGSRVIRTQGQEIYLLFADPTNGDLASTTLSAVAGFFQAASTTVAYDSNVYGCGRMTAEATASTTITIAEFY